jgi:hypothetical protein
MHKELDVIQELFLLLLVVFLFDMAELKVVDQLNFVIAVVVFDGHLMLNNFLYVLDD